MSRANGGTQLTHVRHHCLRSLHRRIWKPAPTRNLNLPGPTELTTNCKKVNDAPFASSAPSRASRTRFQNCKSFKGKKLVNKNHQKPTRFFFAPGVPSFCALAARRITVIHTPDETVLLTLDVALPQVFDDLRNDVAGFRTLHDQYKQTWMQLGRVPCPKLRSGHWTRWLSGR